MNLIKQFIIILIFIIKLFLLSSCGTVLVNNSNKNIISWNDIKWNNILRQKFDYSCGSAAVATLIKYYFNDNITEELVLYILVNQLSPKGINDRKINGFSLLDLKKAIENLGYQAIGININAEDLKKLRGPVIICLNDGILDHFVVLKGIANDRIYFADSSRGNTRMPLFKFYEQWKNNTVLIVGKHDRGLIENHGLTVSKTISPRPEKNVIRQFRFSARL